MISAPGVGKDNPAFVHDDEAKPGQQSTKLEPGKLEPGKPEPGKPGPGKPEPGKPGHGKPGPGEQVVEAPPGIGQQQQVGKEGGKKAQEEDHEFDVEGKSAVSGKKRTGWM